MEQDIHKLADWLVKVTHEGIEIDHKVLEWKTMEKSPLKAVPPQELVKAG